jgi:hypothetical protein
MLGFAGRATRVAPWLARFPALAHLTEKPQNRRIGDDKRRHGE